MRRFLLVLVFIFSACFCRAQFVVIPDANFVAWLQVNYPSCMNGNLMDTTCSGVVNAIALHCQNLSIQDFDGVEYFDNLDTFDCYGNSSSISLLNLPSNLVFLNCSGTDFYYNSLPSTLKYLNCNNNMLAGVSNLPSGVEHLECRNNFIGIIQNLPSALQYLDCANNQIDDFATLPASLTFLNCSNNQILHLTATLPNGLLVFNCSENNDIDSLPTLPPNLINLQCVGLGYVDHLPPLPNSLQILNCDYCFLSSLPQLPTSLHSLSCSGNLIPDLPGLPDTMDLLNVSDNGLICLPELNYFSGSASDFDISANSIQCLSNSIEHVGFIPGIDGMPVCDFNYNPNGCEFDWNVLGNVVSDSDGSCATLNDSTALKNLKVKLFDGGGNLLGQEIITPAGSFSFTTSNGTYSVSVDTANIPFNVICPTNNNITGVISAADSTDTGLQFRMECKPGFDLGLWNVIRSSNFFPWNIIGVKVFAGDFSQSVYGASCGSGINGEVKIVINGFANYVAPLAGALTPSVSGDTLTYTIADFSVVNAATDFGFNVLTDSTATIGDVVCFEVSVTPTVGDNTVSNNTLTHCFAVSNSFDPNEKEVSPVGNSVYPFNEWLTYTVHFQNTGTAPAQHVQIMDTLDSDLDESSFQLLSSSHDPMVQLFGSKVHFNFVAINLPDSTTDSEGSKGYVSYRVKPKNNVAVGSVIENTASIYFDFNSPVVTNTVFNMIVIDDYVPSVSTDFGILVYPNPANNQLTVYSEQLTVSNIQIADVLWRTVKGLLRPDDYIGSRNDKITIDVSGLSDGVYFIRVQTAENLFCEKFVVVH